MKNFKFFIGVDVSKETLDFTLVINAKAELHMQTKNTEKDIDLFFKTVSKRFNIVKEDTICCMEHTGCYTAILLNYLSKKGINTWLESAVEIKYSLGLQRGKNDKVDSKRIAMYAFKNKHLVKLWSAPRKEILQLKKLHSMRNKLKMALTNISKAYSEQKFMEKDIFKLIKESAKHSVNAIKQDIEKVEKAIYDIVRNDKQLWHLFKLITSVKGVGTITACNILIYTNEFKSINDPKKFACYCGVAPFEHSSGSSVLGKTRVSNMANKDMKTYLHMAALAAAHYKGELQDYFHRKVAEGKNKMAVINAIRNKLIHRVFACVRDNRPYQNTW